MVLNYDLMAKGICVGSESRDLGEDRLHKDFGYLYYGCDTDALKCGKSTFTTISEPRYVGGGYAVGGQDIHASFKIDVVYVS